MSLPGGSAAVTASMSVQVAQVTLEKEFDLLQMVLDMISSIENSKDQKDELVRKAVVFKAKVGQCKELLTRIPGIGHSPEEQQQMLQKYKDELQKKRFLDLTNKHHTDMTDAIDDRTKRLEEIDKRVLDITEKLFDLQQEYFKGNLLGPEADKLGRPLRKQRKRLREEKKTILGVDKLCDDEQYLDDEEY